MVTIRNLDDSQLTIYEHIRPPARDSVLNVRDMVVFNSQEDPNTTQDFENYLDLNNNEDFRGYPVSVDIVNLVNHSVGLHKKNLNVDSRTTLSIEPFSNNSDGFIDFQCFHLMNITSQFNPQIMSLRNKIDLLGQNNDNGYIFNLHSESKEILVSFIKMLKLRFSDDVNDFAKTLTFAISGRYRLEDFYPIYNVLLYATPFSLSSIYLGSSTYSFIDLLTMPYEVVSYDIYSMLKNVKVDDLNYLMRLQNKFESSLPFVEVYREYLQRKMELCSSSVEQVRQLISQAHALDKYKYRIVGLYMYRFSNRFVLPMIMSALEPNYNSKPVYAYQYLISNPDIPVLAGTTGTPNEVLGHYLIDTFVSTSVISRYHYWR